MALEHRTYLVHFLNRLTFESVYSCLRVLLFPEIVALFYMSGIYGQHFFLVDFFHCRLCSFCSFSAE